MEAALLLDTEVAELIIQKRTSHKSIMDALHTYERITLRQEL